MPLPRIIEEAFPRDVYLKSYRAAGNRPEVRRRSTLPAGPRDIRE
jgi:hypothetical protein